MVKRILRVDLATPRRERPDARKAEVPRTPHGGGAASAGGGGAWEGERNRRGVKVEWRFTTEKAREEVPSLLSQSLRITVVED